MFVNDSIYQGSAVAFFRCGGQLCNHLCDNSSGFSVPKLCKWFTFADVVKKEKGTFFETPCSIILAERS